MTSSWRHYWRGDPTSDAARMRAEIGSMDRDSLCSPPEASAAPSWGRALSTRQVIWARPRTSSLSRRKLSASSTSRVGQYFSTMRKSAAGEMLELSSGRGTSRASNDSVVVLPQRFSGEVSASRRDAAAPSLGCPGPGR
jgi:hypothetical protein